MGKIEKYSEEFKAKALSMCEEIGPYKTTKELGVANQTLYRWRAQQKKKEQEGSEEKVQPVQQQLDVNEMKKPPQIVEKKEEPEKEQGTSEKPAQETFLLDEVERLKAENQRLQGTLNYLIQENKDLLDKRQRCLEAISLLIQ